MQALRWRDDVLERHHPVVQTCVCSKNSRVPLGVKMALSARENTDLKVPVVSEHARFRMHVT
jgi:hypothetical protein